MEPLGIGIIGMSLLLGAFVLNLFKKMEPGATEYIALNFVGGGLMAVYAYMIDSLPFLVLNLVWGLSAGYRLACSLIKAKA